MSKAQDRAKLAQVQLKLAAKYERLAKLAGSKPKRATYTHQAEKHRLHAADLSR